MDEDFSSDSFDLVNTVIFTLHDLYLKGDDVQRFSVIQALPQLLQYDSQATYNRVIPKIQQALPNSSCEFHVMASKVFKLLMENKVPINLTHTVLQGIDSRDPVISNAWTETLLNVMNVLSEQEIRNEIVPLASTKSQLNQPTLARVSSCKILGKVAIYPKFEPLDVKKDILPLVHGLCQDCHYDVRTAMCSQLSLVAQGLGSNLVKTSLLPSLVELAADDNMNVRAAAVSTVVQMFPYFGVDIKKATIVPLMKQLCEKSIKHDDVTSVTVAKEIGKLVEGLETSLTSADCTWFLQCYKSLARRGLASSPGDVHSVDASQDVMCRQQCAFNLPALTIFTLKMIPAQLDMIYSVFRDLVADPCYIVRRTVAGGLHEIAKILGPQNRMMKADLVRLLRDDAEEVLQTLVPQLGTTLELLCTYGTLSRETSDHATMEIGRAILKCQIELTKGFNWRLFTHFLHQMEHLPNCMPSEFIHQHFTPVVLSNVISGRAKPVRSQAVRTLLVFLRYNNKDLQKKWLRESLITQLCYSKSCYTRDIYIRLCIHAMDIFSNNFFKEYFYPPLLSLADDRIANVRLCMVSLLPALKQMLVLPDDRKLKQNLDAAISRLESQEKDRDVLEILKNKIKESNIPLSGAKKQEFEIEEKRRLDEEERIAGGKLVAPGGGSRKGLDSSKSSSRISDTIGPRPNVSPLQRSTSVPPKGAQAAAGPPSDMNFLKQHFYIDAGIDLPPETLNKEVVKSVSNELIGNVATVSTDNVDVESLTEQDLQLLEESTTNITDDVKVNLRKISKSKLATQIKVKRHSSVLSTVCLEVPNRKSLNRRSLNIPSREFSKIPVSTKIRNQSQNEPGLHQPRIHRSEAVANGINRSCSEIRKLQSNLPVLMRRTQSEARKVA